MLFFNAETDGYQLLQPNPYIQGGAKRHFYTGVSTTGIENVRDYSELHFKDLYQGIDMSLSHNRIGLRAHFKVKRGYDPLTIRMKLDGLTSVNFTAGNLNIGAYQSTYKFHKPVAYQIDANDNITMVSISWAVDMNGMVYFNVGSYDTGRDIFIAVKQGNDPIPTKDAGDNWEWSSYIGEHGISSMRNVTTDVDGNVIYTGVANNINFLNSVGNIITQYSSGGDAYLLKLNLNIEPLWYTFYGGDLANAPGTEAEDVGMAVATGGNKDVHLTGYSQSTDLDMLTGSGYNGDITNDVSTVSGCLECKEIFYARFNENGILQYSTYYGNIDFEIPYDIMVQNGIATIVGERNSNTPLLPKAGADNYSQSDGTGFIMQFDNSNQLIWFNSFDVKRVLSVTSNENLDIIIGGYLSSSNSLPIPNPSSNPNFSTYNGGAFDGFLSVFNSSGILTHGSYYGGNCSDVITDVISNGSGLIHGVGLTSSPDMSCAGSTDIPVMGNGINQVPFGGFDHFYFKTDFPVLNTPINFSHSGYFGGDAAEYGQFTDLAITWSKPSIALFNDGSFAITGATNSFFYETSQQGVKIPFPICQPNFWKVEANKDVNTVISTLLAYDAYISIFDKDAVLRYTSYFGHGYGSEGGTALATYQSGTTNRLYFGGNTQTYNTQFSTADEKLFVEVYEPSTVYNDYFREFGATVPPSVVPYNGWGAMLNVNGLYDAPCILSISEKEEMNGIIIFPNPANDMIEWQGVENVREVKIYSTDGRLVKVVHYKDNNNKAFIGDLSQGQYLIELNTENGVIIKKFFRL